MRELWKKEELDLHLDECKSGTASAQPSNTALLNFSLVLMLPELNN